MKNLKVSAKLILSFGIVLLLMVFLVVFSAIGLTTISADIDTFYNAPFQNVQLLGTVGEDLQESVKQMMQAAVDDDLGKTQELLDEAEALLNSITENVEKVRTTYAGDPSDLDAIENGITEAMDGFAEFEKNCMANNIDAAYQFYQDDIYPNFTVAGQAVYKAQDVARARAKTVYDEASASSFSIEIISIILGVVSVMIGIGLSLYLTKMLTSGINQAKVAAKKVSDGDFNVDITYKSKDEIGQLADDMRILCSRTREVIEDINYTFNELSNGNLTVESRNPSVYVGAYKAIFEDEVSLIDKLNEIMLNINQSADQVASGSEQVSAGAQALASGATEQASSIEELAATIHVVKDKINSNADSAKEASGKTVEAGEAMNSANMKMEELVKAMEEIKNRSAQISDIIKTIEDIAFQTNILSLNAAIEAARAGEAGKGFAVVADEVRNLAAKSADAANNTNELIENTVKAVAQGNELVDEVSGMMQQVSVAAAEVSRLNAGISDSSAEAADSIVQINTGVEQISNVVQTNSATAEESAAASEELSGQAETLKELIAEFKLRDA